MLVAPGDETGKEIAHRSGIFGINSNSIEEVEDDETPRAT